MLLITSDRGLPAHTSSVIKEGEQLNQMLRQANRRARALSGWPEVDRVLRIPASDVAAKWEGFSDALTYAHAREIVDALIEAFLKPTEEGGVDEIHVVYTVPFPCSPMSER